MESAANSGWYQRTIAALILLIPCVAGLAYLASFDAPASYLFINASALIAGLLWAVFGRLPQSEKLARSLSLALLTCLFLPILTGPEIFGIARWLPLGGFNLHVGMAAIPCLAVLSARIETFSTFTLFAGICIAAFQPDPASAMALLGAAIGLQLAQRSPASIVFAVFGLLAIFAAAFSPNLPPQPFVERVFGDAFYLSLATGTVLALSIVVSLILILSASAADEATRYALAGALGGFILASLIGDYPTPLIGYGAAPIIGLALALPALRPELKERN